LTIFVRVAKLILGNVCASTAQKIEEIAARNIIRAEAKLPLLSIPRELRRMKQVADAAAFEDFADRHRESVWEEVFRPGAGRQGGAELATNPFNGRIGISSAGQ
jgi:hypothetical protein